MSLLKLAEDVSAYGLRAVISHIFPDGSKHPIALVIRTIISSERNYAQIEIGALALVFEVQHFHQCHHGRKFTLVTDHKTLMIILDQRRDSIPCSSQTSTLDNSTLSILLKKIEFKSTPLHCNVDAISRLPLDVTDSNSGSETTLFNIYQMLNNLCQT